MASSIRNSFLRVRPWIPHPTRKFWNGCYDASTVFGQSCTELYSGCCCTITRLRTVLSVCTISWFSAAYLFSIIHRTPLIWRLRTSFCFPAWRKTWKAHVLQTWRQSNKVWQRFCDRFLKRPLLTVSRSFMNVAKSVLWRMAISLKANKFNLLVSSILFVFRYHSTNVLDTPSTCKSYMQFKTTLFLYI